MGISVHFLGWRDDVENIYPLADIAVVPSRWEGHPVALLEAMAAGVPVIATEVSSIPEMIISYENGLLVPPSNSKALAEAIKQLMYNQELQVKLREAALITKNNFSLSHMVAGYEKIYQACMNFQ